MQYLNYFSCYLEVLRNTARIYWFSFGETLEIYGYFIGVASGFPKLVNHLILLRFHESFKFFVLKFKLELCNLPNLFVILIWILHINKKNWILIKNNNFLRKKLISINKITSKVKTNQYITPYPAPTGSTKHKSQQLLPALAKLRIKPIKLC